MVTLGRGIAAALFAAIALSATSASALRCDTNPGGPEEIQIILQSAGSDIDIGWKDAAHDVGVPAGSSIRVCLDNCDTTSDPECDISGTIEGVTSGTTTIGPPLPLYYDARTDAACALIQFPPPGVTGTANVQTGAITGSATINAKVFIGACPQCSGTTAGTAGTCQGGASAGAACTTEQVTRVLYRPNQDENADLTPIDYRVSRDCLPAGNPAGTISQQVTVATSTQSVSQPCPGQVSGTNGYHECGVAGCVNTCAEDPGANGGAAQNCCNDQVKACFPDSIQRLGTASAPTPAYPDTTYPKSSTLTLATAQCIQSVNALLIDPIIGAPGPMALLWPGTATWRTDSDADGLYDDLDVTCPFDADCDDDGLIDGARTGSEDLNENGALDPGETDPYNFDSDGDGLPDGLEKGLTAPENPDATDLGAGHFIADLDPSSTTDPDNPDSDSDGIPDGVEDANHNGRVDPGEGDPSGPPAPVCTGPADCNDDDPCTDDVCSATPACTNTPLAGLALPVCEANKVKGRTFCSGTTIDAKLTAAIQKALTTVNSKLAGVGETTGKKRKKALKKARSAITKLQRKVTKAVTKKKAPLPQECATEINAALTELLALIPAS